jgi:hypothetical protein
MLISTFSLLPGIYHSRIVRDFSPPYTPANLMRHESICHGREASSASGKMRIQKKVG